MSKRKSSVVLTKALDLLGPNGEYWIQGIAKKRIKNKTHYCSIAAISKISGGSRDVFYAARDYLQWVIPRNKSVGGWNDTRKSFKDIKGGFEKAIAMAKEEKK